MVFSIREINNKDKELLIELFNANECRYIQAKGEADDELINLYSQNIINGVFTEDNDILVGKTRIYKNFNNYKNYVYEYEINSILRQLKISYEDFISICILAGTTYSQKYCDIFDADACSSQ
jgi:5'-3' exonuclease